MFITVKILPVANQEMCRPICYVHCCIQRQIPASEHLKIDWTDFNFKIIQESEYYDVNWGVCKITKKNGQNF